MKGKGEGKKDYMSCRQRKLVLKQNMVDFLKAFSTVGYTDITLSHTSVASVDNKTEGGERERERQIERKGEKRRTNSVTG